MKTGLESLDTGAPDITYSGNQGPKSPQEMQQMASMEAGQEGTLEDIFNELIEMGMNPEDAAIKAREIYNDMSSRGQGGIGNMAMKSGLIDEYRNYKMGQGDAGEQFMSPRDYYRSQEQDRMGVAYGGTANPTYTQSRKQRINAAGGGIMGSNAGSMLVAPTADGSRPGYGWLSDAKDKLLDFIPNEIKDPIAKLIPNEIKDNPALTAALIGGSTKFLPEGMGKGWLGDLLEKAEGVPYIGPVAEGLGKAGEVISGMGTGIGDIIKGPDEKWLGTDILGLPGRVAGGIGDLLPEDLSNKLFGSSEIGGRDINWKTPLAIGSAMGYAQSQMPKTPLPQDTSGIDMASAIRGDDLRFRPRDEVLAASGGRIGYDNGGIASMREALKNKGYDWLDDADDITVKQIFDSEMGTWTDSSVYRPGKAEGGLMDLGGMEKDYRAEGGFVPIGGQEKADDVPARLSKNEFVFTADAVRSAGGGDIDAGAEVMENVMNNLEQGGQISQESQGLEGARNMFATAQRLGEVM